MNIVRRSYIWFDSTLLLYQYHYLLPFITRLTTHCTALVLVATKICLVRARFSFAEFSLYQIQVSIFSIHNRQSFWKIKVHCPKETDRNQFHYIYAFISDIYLCPKTTDRFSSHQRRTFSKFTYYHLSSLLYPPSAWVVWSSLSLLPSQKAL